MHSYWGQYSRFRVECIEVWGLGVRGVGFREFRAYCRGLGV